MRRKSTRASRQRVTNSRHILTINTAKMIFLYIAAFLFATSIFWMWLFYYRNDDVYEFRNRVLDLEHALIVDGGYGRDFEYYEMLPSYEAMVFRFWEPLELETYLPDDAAERLREYERVEVV